MSLWLAGISLSRGIAIGRVLRLHGDLEIPECELPADAVEAEFNRYRDARERARDQLKDARTKIPKEAPVEVAAFIDTHLLMLDDRTLGEAVIALIEGQRLNAEAALKRQRDALVSVFERMDDPYLRGRKDDVQQVSARILRILLKQERNVAAKTEQATEPSIVIADDITPADIILLSQQSIAGFVTEYGSPLSHTAILARSLGIPAAAGIHGARRLLRDSELLIIDGDQGHVLADPDPIALDFYRNKHEQQRAQRVALSRLRDHPAISRDGMKIHLLANIERIEDAAHAAGLGAEGVGLYRTEFLYMNRKDLPGEEEQYQAYARMVRSVKGPITLRTLDLGADKQADCGRRLGLTPNNPALGLRAIRLCLKEPDLFRTQVRALLRASVHGCMQIMLPMISNVSEFKQALGMIESSREQLLKEGHAVADDVPVGAMIEVPAAALAAPLLARHAHFFSIGTNDLIQYTLAIDRVDDEVNYLYDPLNLGVLRLIRMTIQAGEQAGRPVAMCGEMAGDPKYTRLLLGLGLTEFSMHPAGVLEIKRIIIDSDVAQLRRKAERLLETNDAKEIQQLIGEL